MRTIINNLSIGQYMEYRLFSIYSSRVFTTFLFIFELMFVMMVVILLEVNLLSYLMFTR
ncbi:hypothetical protein NMY3_01528 [Candidatus Nitrosocosmicus oleophilus]|uniref:Uncharacterized protein n=1 Tax=Candidatus Nitrosocosmicus oleophilus TaxID=1353260 RepID=A0A654LZP1_9ARCH|nr:hypothetical protein NMY3_01528 [Candidatus Nitrosocosmicus oleophilus]